MKFPDTCQGKNYPHKWEKQCGDLSTAGQSIKITLRLSQQFPAVDIFESFLHVKEVSVVNVSEVHAASCFRFKGTHYLLLWRFIL
jgi:hypothetical protein